MSKSTYEEILLTNLAEIHNLIDHCLANPEKDMSVLEQEITKICDFINIHYSNSQQANPLIKKELEGLIDKVTQLSKIIKDKVEKITSKKRGYKAYNEIMINEIK